MMNYLKSEWYRVVHGKELYLMCGILSAVVLAANVILYAMTFVEDGFPYASVRFSLSNLLYMMTVLFALGGVLVAVLYADDRKNGTMKNAIVHGCSRTSLFIGKSLVSVAAGLVCMAVVLVVYIGSAALLLEGPAAEPSIELVMAVVAALPSVVAIVVLAVALDGFFSKTTTAVVAFVVIVFVIPQALALIGLRYEPVAELASWFPAVLFGNDVGVWPLDFTMPWNQLFGWLKCMLVGFGWLAVFAVAGLWRARKVEL